MILELGGNAAVIVHGGAPQELAVSRIIQGGFGQAGQSCISVQRVFIQDSVYDGFVERLVEATRRVKVGDPLDPKTDMGPLIDQRAALTVQSKVEEAVKDGAQLLCGGQRKGAFYQPTVLDQVRPDMQVVREETFGPVSPIIRVKTEKEAYKMANYTRYGLRRNGEREQGEHGYSVHRFVL